MARPLDHQQPQLTRLGPPQGQARRELLLLHGAWAGAWLWQPLDQTLAQAGYGVNLLELPGHGAQAWDLPSFTSLRDYAQIAARAAAQLEQPVIIGHSLGGWLAQKLLEVADLPAILLAPLPGSGLPFTRALRLLALDPLGMAGTLLGRPLKVRDPQILHRLCFRRLDMEETARQFTLLGPEPARVALEMGMGLARACPGAGSQPRLLLAAGQDFFMPVASMRKLSLKLGAQFVLLEDYPHNLWQEDPEGRVARVVLDFLQRLT